MKKRVVLLLIVLLVTMMNACTDELEDSQDTYEPTTSSDLTEVTGSESEMVDLVVYPHDEVIELNIDISTDNYDALINNAALEEYYDCDITYNGYLLENVAIRTKGNSSLKDVIESGDDRFSYNIDLNYYEDQDLFGIDKLILNNLFRDPSMMAEYISYEALDSLNMFSSRTTYVALSINGEYYGLYLSVEHIGNEYLDTYFGNSDGELYKPEQGVGANLDYISESTNYTALVDENAEDLTNNAVIELLKRIESGENLEEIFDVDSYLKYLAVNTYTVNLDSYQAGMSHNYYLYNNDGVFEWLAWDLNMAFNGFPGINLTDLETTQYLIDEPVVGAMSNYPLIDIILTNDTYLELYHTYMQELIEGYYNYETFEARVYEIDALISEYVASDANSFFSFTEYEDAVFDSSNASFSLLEFVQARTTNVTAQLEGDIRSTNNGQGNIVTQGPMTPPPRR